MDNEAHNGLGTAISRWAEEAGLSVHAASVRAGVNPSTVRGWIKAKRYNPEELAKLLRALGVEDSIEELTERYQVQWTRGRTPRHVTNVDSDSPLVGVLAELDDKLDRLRRVKSDAEAEISDVLGGLGEGDALVFVSLDVVPSQLKQTPTNNRKRVVQAIAKGAHFLYMLPNAAEIGSLFRDDPNRRGSGILREGVQAFVRDVEQVTAQRHAANGVIVAVECENFPFFVPQHRFVLVRCGSSERHAVRGLGAFPVGNPDDERTIVHLPLDAATTTQLHRLVLRELDSQIERSEGVAREHLQSIQNTLQIPAVPLSEIM